MTRIGSSGNTSQIIFKAGKDRFTSSGDIAIVSDK